MNHPIAYVTIANSGRREKLATELRRTGWSVVELATGAHLLAALADVIDGTATELPTKIIVEARARGCTGTSIAAGLAALGLTIPVEVIDDPPPDSPPPPWCPPSVGALVAARAA